MKRERGRRRICEMKIFPGTLFNGICSILTHCLSKPACKHLCNLSLERRVAKAVVFLDGL